MRTSPRVASTTRPWSGLIAETRGSGPPVVLVHGVGVGPESFGSLAELLEAHATVTIVHRPGYARAEEAGFVPLDQQVWALDELVASCAHTHRRPVVLVGVSGGATLSLHLVMGRCGSVATAVLHEPLVGRLAPALHTRVLAGAERAGIEAAGSGGVDAEKFASAFLTDLVGPATWAALSPQERAAAVGSAGVLAAEVPAFAALAVEQAQLEACVMESTRIVTTVGQRSGPERDEAARVLVDLAGAECLVVRGAGHLAHVDAPEAFAASICAVLDAPEVADDRGDGSAADEETQR